MARIPGPYLFEPHNGYGGSIDGEPWPFGYISTDHPSPIFELSTPLAYPLDQLVATARLLAAAPDLLDACKFAFAAMNSEGGRERAKAALVAAIAKAEGR